MKTRKLKKPVIREEPSESKEEAKSPLVRNSIFKQDDGRCCIVQNTNIKIEMGDDSDCMTGCFDFLKSIFKR